MYVLSVCRTFLNWSHCHIIGWMWNTRALPLVLVNCIHDLWLTLLSVVDLDICFVSADGSSWTLSWEERRKTVVAFKWQCSSLVTTWQLACSTSPSRTSLAQRLESSRIAWRAGKEGTWSLPRLSCRGVMLPSQGPQDSRLGRRVQGLWNLLIWKPLRKRAKWKISLKADCASRLIPNHVHRWVQKAACSPCQGISHHPVWICSPTLPAPPSTVAKWGWTLTMARLI